MTHLAVLMLILPSGYIVLQRRSGATKFGPGKLGLFGGHVEDGETPEDAVKREIVEETSLKPEDLNIAFVKDFLLKADQDYPKDRHTHLFKGMVRDLNFKVKEGNKAEVYPFEEVLRRSDLTVGVQHILKEIDKEK